MNLKESGYLTAAFLCMVTGFLGGGWLGGQADAWLERHPGPCLIGDKAECEAYSDEGIPLAMVGGLVGGVATVALFRLAVRTREIARGIKGFGR